MLMRVAVGIHKADIDAAVETYNLLSEKWFTHASPTLFNSGTNKPQLSRYRLGTTSKLYLFIYLKTNLICLEFLQLFLAIDEGGQHRWYL